MEDFITIIISIYSHMSMVEAVKPLHRTGYTKCQCLNLELSVILFLFEIIINSKFKFININKY